ncbi:hypothetical protein [Nocardia otitidiscaviarum]|uniref:hypothetical protein n=1 Tax=Nocardia otitidiscaviarum TaxID=1823 RepID=UPI002456FBB9|nr:hypothetical protein [Nocardia otitidiscaviarum]
MNQPRLLDYQQAVQNPSLAFRNDQTLRYGDPVRNAQGMPSVASGGFAATFQLAVPPKNRYAVRCFHRHTHLNRDLLERYRHIETFSRSHRDVEFLLDVAYRADGVVVNEVAYPTVRMPWVNGEALGIWVEDWVESHGEPATMETVRTQIRRAVARLRSLGAAHGDLQHGNILVLPDGTIRLIDYDGMYLPEFSRLPELNAIEQGHRNYQHPGRAHHFDDTLDLFSAQVIDLSLRALSRRPQLWDTFGGTGESLLFTARDFADPARSGVFAELAGIPELADQTRVLRRACEVEFTQVPAVLTGRTVRRTTTASFTVGTEDVFAAEELRELRDRYGDDAGLQDLSGQTITVFGTVRFGSVTVKRGGRNVALLNLGDYKQGDFTIVAYDDVAMELYRRYGEETKNGKRRLSGLQFWRVAISGTLELYPYYGKLVPQIVLPRAGRLHNLGSAEFEELRAKAARRRTANRSPGPTPPRSTVHPTPPPPADARRPVPPASPSQQEADRWAKISRLYENHPRQGSPRLRPQHDEPPPVPPPRQTAYALAPYIVPSTPPEFPHPALLPSPPPLAQPPRPPDRPRRFRGALWFLLPVALLAAVPLLERRDSGSESNTVAFQSPDHAVRCLITPRGADTGIRCDVQPFTYIPPPKPPHCAQPDYGRTVILAAGGAAFECVPDPIAASEFPVLATGETTAAGTYSCTGESAGVTCRDTRPGGGRFHLTPDAFTFG